MAIKAKIAKSMIHNIKNECRYSLVKRLLLPFKLKYGYRIDYPQYVWIDITNECNLRCIMCPQSKGLKRKKMTMEMDTFTRIVDQVCINKPRIILHVSGEPLLNKNVFEMIKYVKDKGCKVTMFTNATLLTKEASIRIMESSLDNIFFSFDGCTPEIYEKIRVGASFDHVKSQIEDFLKLRSEMNRKTPIVVIEIILMKETENNIPNFIKYWEKKGVDRIGIRLAGTWCGLVDDHRVKTNIKVFGFKPCDNLFFGCAILAEGTVIPCCKDVEGRLPLGNILEQSFDEIWNGNAYNDLRRQHIKNVISKNIICYSCAHTRCWNRKEQVLQWFLKINTSFMTKK
jgi:radical SAM protein with 4Fe4S-binding SPASM domain